MSELEEEEATQGGVRVANEVIASIAAMAACEVDGGAEKGRQVTLEGQVRRAATQPFDVQAFEAKEAPRSAARAAELRKRAPQKLTHGSSAWAPKLRRPFSAAC